MTAVDFTGSTKSATDRGRYSTKSYGAASICSPPSPAVSPPPANVSRKAQVVRLPRATKPKPALPVAGAGPKRATVTKPPGAKGKNKATPTQAGVTTAEPTDDTLDKVDIDYDTDELAELPTDSELEPAEADPGENDDQQGKQ